MIPGFDKNGNLPPGKPYTASWQEIVDRFGYNEKRKLLLKGLKMALEHLKSVGCGAVYLDGSFITIKKEPKDWDACWLIDGVNFNALDPLIVDESFHHQKRKKKYKGDLFLHSPKLPSANWINRFQKDRDGNRKGIIHIDLEALS